MTVHIESPLGFTADFPDHTLVLDDSTAGPNTEQYGLLGDVLVTIIPDDASVEGPAQANGWAHLMASHYLDERGGNLLTEGELNLPGKAAYAVVVGYDDARGDAKAAATVGVWEKDRFIGVVVIWPYVDPQLEPRIGLLKDVVGAIRVS